MLRKWAEHGRKIGRLLRREVELAPLAGPIAQLQSQQVSLITSLPLSAAEKIHELSQEQLVTGGRWEALQPHIRNELATRAITAIPEGVKSRANTIARTETARVQSNVTAVRAVHIGSTGFIWRTMLDKDVRPLHRGFEGQFYPWSQPPRLDDNRPGLPGTIYNCRCYAEPVFPDVED
jgi:SPP1 gp7 family putative phage head morphogenesis protein